MGRNKKTGAFTMPGWDPGQGTGYVPPTTTTLDNGAPILDGKGNYLHDWGLNLNSEGNLDESGSVYANTNAGYARYATDQNQNFNVRSQDEIDAGWKSYQESAFPQPETTGGGAGPGSGMGGVNREESQINQNMQDVNLSASSGSGGSGKSKINRNKNKYGTHGKSNFDEAKEIGTYDGEAGISWRQKRRLLGGGNKSKRQLKRLKNQEARKKQRAKNRRERGWGGFGWNRKR